MINYIFTIAGTGMQLPLYADDAAIWKRGTNFKIIYNWGLKISVAKACYMLITKKKISTGQRLNYIANIACGLMKNINGRIILKELRPNVKWS